MCICTRKSRYVILHTFRYINITQYDQCDTIGATARIDYQRGEALDVIMLTTLKKRKREKKDVILYEKETDEGTVM